MNNMMEKYKFAVLISHPIQYHVPIFQALAKDPRIDLMVYYCWDFGVGEAREEPEFGVKYSWDIPMLEGYTYKFLKNWSLKPSSTSFWGQINPSIIGELRREKYDGLLVHGYSFFTNWLAFFAARGAHTPIFLRGITHILDKRPWYVRLAKRMILPPLFRMVSKCMYIGEHNKAYYKEYGARDEKLMHLPHVVSNKFFKGFDEKLRPEREKIKKEFGVPSGKPVILFAGKLIPKKRPMWALKAYEETRKATDSAFLVAGDGPLRKKMEAYVEKNNIPDVSFVGFLNQTELPRAYVSGDVFVLPSGWGETWGLTINEALNFGLPVIVSDKVGCGGNLVKEGENGYIIKSFDELVVALEELVSDSEKRKEYSKKSREIISHWGVPEAVESIVNALRSNDRLAIRHPERSEGSH